MRQDARVTLHVSSWPAIFLGCAVQAQAQDAAKPNKEVPCRGSTNLPAQ
jgi:hypothetical protein